MNIIGSFTFQNDLYFVTDAGNVYRIYNAGGFPGDWHIELVKSL